MHNVPTQGVIQATWPSTKTLARLFLALLGLPRLPRREPGDKPCDIEQQRISWLSRGGLGYLSFICHESLEKQQISSRTMNSWTMISKGESHCNSGPFSIPVTKRKKSSGVFIYQQISSLCQLDKQMNVEQLLCCGIYDWGHHWYRERQHSLDPSYI